MEERERERERGGGGGGIVVGGASDDDDDDAKEPRNIIINEMDGLPNVRPNYRESTEPGSDGETEEPRDDRGSAGSLDDFFNDEDPPTSVIVTNVDRRVFEREEARADLERLFGQFGRDARFRYFGSFGRIRVDYGSAEAAVGARVRLHRTLFGDTRFNCYFAQPVTPVDAQDRHLRPPALTKQFLVSPPASPPVGWEPRQEGEPLVNHDLLAAIANLSPGCSHELHPGGAGQPGIVVHVCENVPDASKGATRAPPTPRPEKERRVAEDAENI